MALCQNLSQVVDTDSMTLLDRTLIISLSIYLLAKKIQFPVILDMKRNTDELSAMNSKSLFKVAQPIPKRYYNGKCSAKGDIAFALKIILQYHSYSNCPLPFIQNRSFRK